MASHPIAEVQTKLKSLGFDPGPIDGAAGTMTDAAVAKFQTSKGLTASGTLDEVTIGALFPSSSGPKTIAPTLQDWILNLVLSETNWAAAAMVGILVTFLQTKFGLDLPQDVQNNITKLVAAGFGALIWVLQTRFNSPHVATKQPAVIVKPAELK